MRLPLAFDATITREDFARLLRLAAGAAEFRASDDAFSGPGWRIRLTPLDPLAIGIVKLERHHVEIEFDGLTMDEQDSFMQRFTLCFQRGGG
jgi:hypothetical protein